ncbi:MAG: serine/threonine protein kinase, partial [Psychrosphaera sp.]|nr:serine/threonine protein kinase [Psychrosphaera sp.]
MEQTDIGDLVAEFFELPKPQRPAYLAQLKLTNAPAYQLIHCAWSSKINIDDTSLLRLLVADVFANDTDDQQVQALSGTSVDEYQILQVLGIGGMGVVYLAERKDIAQKVALKFIYPSVVQMMGKDTLLSEAKALAQLNHPNIAKIYTIGSTDTTLYFVSEYVNGRPMDEQFDAQRYSDKEQLTLMSKLCESVQYVHQRGIIHADLKPSNILIDQDNNLKIIDFGVSLMMKRSGNAQQSKLVSAYIKGMSYQYASPEQIEQRNISTLSDIYSLGKIAQFCCSKRLTLQREFKAVMSKACQSDAQLRQATAQDLSRDLQNIADKKVVESYSTGKLYRIRKFVQRNPAYTLASSFFMAVVAVFSMQLVSAQQKTLYEKKLANQSSILLYDMLEIHVPNNA